MTTTKKKAPTLAQRVTELEDTWKATDKFVVDLWNRITALEQAQRPSSALAELSRIVDDIKNLRPVPGDMLCAAERVLDAEETRLRDAVVDAALAWGLSRALNYNDAVDKLAAAVKALRAHRAKKGGAS